MQEVTTGMIQRGINNLEWVDREGRRRKIKLSAQKDLKTKNLYIKHLKRTINTDETPCLGIILSRVKP